MVPAEGGHNNFEASILLVPKAPEQNLGCQPQTLEGEEGGVRGAGYPHLILRCTAVLIHHCPRPPPPKRLGPCRGGEGVQPEDPPPRGTPEVRRAEMVPRCVADATHLKSQRAAVCVMTPSDALQGPHVLPSRERAMGGCLPGAWPARYLCMKYPGSSPKSTLSAGSPPRRSPLPSWGQIVW